MASSGELTSSLAGKVALVTGSSRGIGAAIARRFANEGANVVVNYVSSAQAAETVVSEINSLKGAGTAVAVKADASTVSGGQYLISETIRLFGKLDILVLNAAISSQRVLSEIDEEYFDSHVNANIRGPLFLAKNAAGLLPSGGRMIFFSSTLTSSSYVTPNALMYTMTKGAIEQISRILAKDLGTRGITVNSVSPGPVDTALFREGRGVEAIEIMKSINPQKRIGEVEEIASVVAFLASPASRWVNGQNLRINGGYVV